MLWLCARRPSCCARRSCRGSRAKHLVESRSKNLRRRPWQPVSLRGFGGSKALLVRGELRNAVAVVVKGEEAFVGIPRKARNKEGELLVDIAQIQEFGSEPMVIPMTPAMRAFLFKALREAGIPPSDGAGRGVVVVKVPARPFLRPAFEAFKEGAEKRFPRAHRGAHGYGWTMTAPTILNVYPSSGPTSGGELLRIAGEGFTERVLVQLGEAQAVPARSRTEAGPRHRRSKRASSP